MIKDKEAGIFYQALLDRNSQYDGLFFVGIKTTGVFCHPTCPARKPKYENCEFFRTSREALLASYRPCMRCKPLSNPHDVSKPIQKLISSVENHPHKRWRDEDFRKIGIDSSTARRQFKKRFNMTFVEYARARRMGIAMKHIRQGGKIIDAQLMTGFASESGFRDAFTAIMGAVPTKNTLSTLLSTWIDTILGPMLAIVDDDSLILLEFVDRRGLEREIERLRKKLKCAIIPGSNHITSQITTDLKNYFEGKNFTFTTPIKMLGSKFQIQVWQTLMTIKPGTTISYQELAQKIDNPKAVRAVANANGANQLALIIPCHRVINANNELGGYGGGLPRKLWLIEHESEFKISN